jgi:hypothetical protein
MSAVQRRVDSVPLDSEASDNLVDLEPERGTRQSARPIGFALNA